MGATAGMFLMTGAETFMTVSANEAQGRALRRQGAYESAAMHRNASVAEAQALDAITRGATASFLRRSQGRQDVGTARAALGAQGIALDVGSGADVQDQLLRLSALDEATIRNNAAREAWGYRSQASEFLTRGRNAMGAADNAALGLRAQSASTLITGLSQTYGVYRQQRDGGKTPKPKKT